MGRSDDCLRETVGIIYFGVTRHKAQQGTSSVTIRGLSFWFHFFLSFSSPFSVSILYTLTCTTGRSGAAFFFFSFPFSSFALFLEGRQILCSCFVYLSFHRDTAGTTRIRLGASTHTLGRLNFNLTAPLTREECLMRGDGHSTVSLEC